MSLLDSLLDAIVRLGGDSLVMHVGERPYVVTSSRSLDAVRGPLSWGQVELSSRPLTPDAVLSMLAQVLSPEARHEFDDVGAVEHEIDSPDGQHRFVVVAARGGDDVWVEVRVKHDPPSEQVEQASPSAEEGGRDEAPVPAVNLASGLAGADAVVQAIAVSGGEPGTPDADPRAALEAPEAEVRAEAAAAAAARESEQRAAHERREAELRALLETREAEVRAEAAALLASRETELAEQAAAALARHEQELAANAADALAAHKAEIENEWAVRAAALAEQADTTARAAAAALADVEQALSARETRLEALYERLVERESALAATEAASARRLADRAAELEAAFAMRLADADARACERKAAMDDAFEGRLSDAIAAAAKELETGLLTREKQRAAETAAAAAVEQEALAAAEAVAMRTAIDRAALDAEMQAALLAEQAASTNLRPEPAQAVGATPFVDMVAQGEDDARPVALLLPRHGAAGHSSTAVLLDVLHDGLERGASAVYAIGGSRPLMRVEDEITSSASLPVLHGPDIDRFAFEFAPRDEVAHSTSEWTTTLPGVGRVRCVSFEDAAGRGLVFHLAANISTADELGLSREIQALCNEPDGLIVLAGPRASGKSTLLSAFVDRINRSRSDHVITIESRVRTLHERRHSLISQREVDGEGAAIARAARAALREGPDVLVIDDARSPEAIAVAIDAARAGRLVFASMPAPSTTEAIERLTDAFSADRRPQVRALLSGALRAVISQVLVDKATGGRIAAREVLLSSPPVAQLIVDGAFGQVPIAIEGGRRLGMCTLTDSLVALVRDGVVKPAEAVRNAPNRRVILAALQQDGIDVGDLERRA